MRAYKQTTCCVSLTDVSRHADRLLTLTAELTAFSRGTGCTTDHGHNRSMWNATGSGNYSVLTCCDCGWSPPLETLSTTVTSKQHIRSPETHSTNYVSAHCGFHKKDWKTLLVQIQARLRLHLQRDYKALTTQFQSNLLTYNALAVTIRMTKRTQRDAKRAGGAKNFRPASDPLPGGAGRPKFNQLEIVNTFTYKPSSVRIDAHNFEL